MDLSATPFDRDSELRALPQDVAAAIDGINRRRVTAAAPTPGNAASDPLLFRPLHGAFNGPMAGAVMAWRKG